MSDWLYEAHTVNALSENSEDGNAVFRYLPQGWSTDTGAGEVHRGGGSSCKPKQPAAPTRTLHSPTLASCLLSEAQGSSP